MTAHSTPRTSEQIFWVPSWNTTGDGSDDNGIELEVSLVDMVKPAAYLPLDRQAHAVCLYLSLLTLEVGLVILSVPTPRICVSINEGLTQRRAPGEYRVGLSAGVLSAHPG
jgi:hypothetical protein